MPKFRKRPVVIEAVQLTQMNGDTICRMGVELRHDQHGNILYGEVRTLEGVMHADLGDWIIRGVKGEFYPCKPDIFEKTYEPVD